LLELEELPRHLVIIGGSYVGLEFAQMFRRFGSEVTVIERSPRLLQREDPDVTDALRDILEREGIAVRTSAECIAVEPRGPLVCARLDCGEGAREVIGSHLLLAVGRRPNTGDVGLDKAGVRLDARGYVVVDDSLRTTADGIWALGDCNGKGAFTHTAYDDFELVAANLLDGRARRVSDRITAYALYTDPPLGRAGLSEAEARKTGKRVLVGRRPMTRVSRAREKGETQGFMKLVADADSGQILGAAILGTDGDEAIHCIIDAMYARLPYRALREAVHIHPTVAELVPTVIGELE
jgi:pyruvate/2-oxoglutarate dehydrogenase complex dihydrolipoamide dehydrogenase (E3) component